MKLIRCEALNDTIAVAERGEFVPPGYVRYRLPEEVGMLTEWLDDAPSESQLRLTRAVHLVKRLFPGAALVSIGEAEALGRTTGHSPDAT